MLPWAVQNGQTSVIYGMMAVVGLGVGIRMNPSSLHGLAYFPDKTSQITCLVSFAVPFGGLVGLTIMSTVLNNKSGPDQSDPKNGIKWAFVSMIPFMWVAVILTTLLGNVWILKDGGHEVVNGAYLWRLVMRKKLQKIRMSSNDVSRVGYPEREKEHDVESPSMHSPVSRDA